jgi:Tol biopolymer transport system component
MRRSWLVIAIVLLSAAALAAVSPAQATTAGVNGRIVFRAVTGDGSSQVFVVGSNGHRLRQITHLAGDAMNPEWSPNGRWIVFERDLAERCSIALMRPDGSHLRTLPPPPGSGCDAQPSFTAGGGRILFESYNPTENDDAIWVERLDGSHQRRLGSGTALGATDPNASPDGLQMTFVAFNNQDLGQGLMRTGINGHHPQLLLPYSFDVAIKHDWSPDGERIAFSDDADNFDASANIGTIRPDGGGLRWLTHFTDPELRAYVGSYSPDGRWIVYRLEDHERYALMRMRADGTHRRVILPLSDFRPRGIDWGPASIG